MLSFIKYLLFSRHANHLICFALFNPQNKPMQRVLILMPIFYMKKLIPRVAKEFAKDK